MEALEELDELGLLHASQGLVETISEAVREVIRGELEQLRAVERVPEPDYVHDGAALPLPFDPDNDDNGDHGDRVYEEPFGLEPAAPAPARPADPERSEAIRETLLRARALR